MRELAMALPGLTQPRYQQLAIKVAIFVLFIFCIWPAFAFAADTTAATSNGGMSDVTLQDFLVNLSTQIPYLMKLFTALAYVMGMYFIFIAIFKLKQYGESRTMMSSEHSIKAPLILMAVGALLLYLPTSVQVGMSTFWTEPSPYGYIKLEDQWGQFIKACFLIIQLVGVVSFIRGLVILSHLSGHGQPGTMGKGFAHIIGGILCINIYQFVQVIMVTFFNQSIF